MVKGLVMNQQGNRSETVLLVAANSHDDRNLDAMKAMKAKKSAHALPPLGTVYVATYAQRNGWTVELLDAERDLLSEEETVQEVLARLPDGGFVGWTTWITTINKVVRIGEQIKLRCPSIKQFLGGPHMSAVPIKTMERFGHIFPYGIVGEGELVTDILLRHWGDIAYLSDVPGIVCYDAGTLRFKKDKRRGYTATPKFALKAIESGKEIDELHDDAVDEGLAEVYWPMHAERIEDVNQIAIPKYEFLGDLSCYHLSEFTPPEGEHQMSMITSRGCPYTCSFCDQEVSGHNWRGLTPKNTIAHMLYLKRLGIDYLYLTDDLYLVRLDDVEETAKLILKTPELHHIRWEAITRINLVLKAARTEVSYEGRSMNLLQLIRKAGCVQLHVAPETGNQQLRFETVFKRITNAEVVAAIEAMAQVGISAKLLNMVGLPGETPEITLETLEFIKTLGEHGAAYGMISVFTPLPTTPAAQMIERGLLKWTGDLDNWDMMNLGTPAGIFQSDMRGQEVDATPEHILMAARGKHKLGTLVGERERSGGLTIEDKIDRVRKLVDDYRTTHPIRLSKKTLHVLPTN